MASNKAQLNWWYWQHVCVFQIRQMKSILTHCTVLPQQPQQQKILKVEMGQKETGKMRQGQQMNEKGLKSVRFHRSLTSSNTKKKTNKINGHPNAAAKIHLIRKCLNMCYNLIEMKRKKRERSERKKKLVFVRNEYCFYFT